MKVGKSLQDFHFSFNPDKLKLFCRSVTIVKEKFFSRLNNSFREYSDAMIAIDHDYFCVAIRIN